MKRGLIKLALTLALLLALFHLLDISPAGILDRLRNFGFVVGAALLPLTLIPWVSASRWGYLLGLSGIKERMTVLWGFNWKATFLGLFLPGSQGMDFFRILFIERRHPGSRGVAGSTVVIERMIGFLLLGLFALLALSFVYDEERFRPVLVLVLAMDGGLFLLLSAVFLVRWKAPAPGGSRIARMTGRALQYLHRLHQAVQRFPYRLGLLPTVLWLAAFQLSLVTVVHLLFLAFDQPVPFVQNLLLYPLIGMLTVVPLTVSGFGVREGAFVFFYSLVGVPAEVAVGVSLLTYLLVIGIPSLLGGLLLLFDRGEQTSIPRG
jgi:uncharacterized protein (TIRG00374 family)